MIDKELQKIIDDRMAELPKESREAIIASQWESKLQALCKKHGLLLDEAENIHTETLLIILALGYPEEYFSHITNRSGIDEGTAKKLVKDIEEVIFQPLFEDIMKRNEKKTDEHHELFDEGNNASDQKESSSNRVRALHPKRDDVLSGIENPEKTSPSLSKLKLTDMFTQKPTLSNHTEKDDTGNAPAPAPAPSEPVPAPAPIQPTNQKTTADATRDDIDPYREPIED